MLTNRQLLILQVIIDDFISSAQPVGSRALSKKEEITFSSATIRNEMADLEEHGYIEKTHSSSGRIPSEKGYRYYVDHLLSPWHLTKEDMTIVRSLFAGKIYELEKIIQKSAQILSLLTNYTAIALGPTVTENRLKRIQIVPINQEKAVAIIVTDTGHVENHMISFPASIEPTDIEKMVNILNDKLIGVPLVELQDKIYKEVAVLLKAHIRHYDLFIKDISNLFEIDTHEKVYFSGKTNMLSQPEFNDITKIKSLLSLIDKEEEFYNLIRKNQASQTGINVKIGRENKVSEMENCSLITASYSIGSESLGTIAILGPTRMEYSRVISLMKFISSDLSLILTNLYQNK